MYIDYQDYEAEIQELRDEMLGLRIKYATYEEQEERTKSLLEHYNEQLLKLTYENRKLEYFNHKLQKQIKKYEQS